MLAGSSTHEKNSALFVKKGEMNVLIIMIHLPVYMEMSLFIEGALLYSRPRTFRGCTRVVGAGWARN